MVSKSEITSTLKRIANHVEQELKTNYTADLATLIGEKVKTIFKNLNFTTHKKSIAVYVSPVFEKVIYLDIRVEEKIIIDSSFEIREIVRCKKRLQEYLILVISGKKSSVYRMEATQLTKMVTDAPGSVAAVINEVPERVANFSDMSDRKEAILHKFLHRVDEALGILLKAYHFPVVVIGPERVMGHFKKISKYSDVVIEYIHGNYDEASINDIGSVLQPYLIKWNEQRQQDLLGMLENAASHKKLAMGIRNVWKEASSARGRLLVVENDYMYPGKNLRNPPVVYLPAKPYSKFYPVKDSVDDVIEKVLESGGDVEFVEKDLLKDYQHIALIQYY